MASSAPPPTTKAVSLASHNPSIDENEKPIVGGKQLSSPPRRPTSGAAAAGLRPPQPAMKEKLRSYLVSTHFQCAVQLTVGVAFLSLFVLVEQLRFPMSCQAAVIYGKRETFFFLFFIRLLFSLFRTSTIKTGKKKLNLFLSSQTPSPPFSTTLQPP
jgi:hypothetical protein